MDVAVPANLQLRPPGGDAPLPDEPDWAPLTFTFGGIWEIAPQASRSVCGAVQVIDVREPAEFTEPLGHIPGRAACCRWADAGGASRRVSIASARSSPCAGPARGPRRPA